MPANLSLYLDAIRVLAAVVVFMGHFSQQWLGGGLFWQTQVYGHTAVIVFFVLSGYVVSFAAETREGTLRSYATARLSRILSVSIPALAISAALLLVGTAIDPAHYAELEKRGQSFTQTSLVGQFLAGLFFVDESWGVHIRVLGNTPYWSLAYEFWYYVIFGSITFLRGRQRLISATVACLIAGPKILLMAPIWMAGAAAWRWRNKIPDGMAWPLAIGSAVLFALLAGDFSRQQSIAFHDVWWPMEFRSTDHLIGLTVALHIAAIGAIAKRQSPIHPKLAQAIKSVSVYTFSIYLLHYPLLVFLGAILPGQPDAIVRRTGLLFGTSLAIYALAQISEQRRPSVKVFLNKILKPRGQ